MATIDVRRRRARRMTSPSIAHSMAFGVAASAGTLVLQLLTGVLTARLLGPEGRGEIEAIMSWVNVGGILFAFGFFAGLGYLQATADEPSGAVLGAALSSTLALGLVGVAVAQLLIPIGFAEQRPEVVTLARVMMFGIIAVMGTNAVRGLLASNDFFLASSLNVVGQPLLYALGAVTLWIVGAYSVAGITFVQVGSFAAMFVAGAIALWLTSGIARPDRTLVRAASTYGLRSYGSTLSRLANVRLDVAIMPAFVVADEIGLYVVAVSVGSMMVALFQQVNRVVFTNTARLSGDERVALVERVLRIVVFSASAMAIVLALIGPELIAFVYGEDFRDAATPLRILLIGLVMWTCSTVLSGALAAAGLPGRTSIAQFGGVLVTLVGLLVLLPRLGIDGAALTSSLSYTTVALVNLGFARRSFGLSGRRVLAVGALRADVGWVAERFRRTRHPDDPGETEPDLDPAETDHDSSGG